jgi:hypothetical protein
MQEEGQWLFVRTDRTPKVVWVITCGYPEDGSEELYVCRVQTNSEREWLLQKRFSEIHALFAEIGAELPDRTQSHFTTTLGSVAKARALTAIINPAPISKERQLDNIELFARKEALSGFLQASVTQLPHFSRSACETVLNFLQDPSIIEPQQLELNTTADHSVTPPSPFSSAPSPATKKPWFQSSNNASPVSVAAVNGNPGVIKNLFTSSSEQALTKCRTQMAGQDEELEKLRSQLDLAQAKLADQEDVQAEREYRDDLAVEARKRADEATRQNVSELKETVVAQRQQLSAQLDQLDRQAHELWECKQEVEALAPFVVKVAVSGSAGGIGSPMAPRPSSAPLLVECDLTLSRSNSRSFNGSTSSSAGGLSAGYESDVHDEECAGGGKNTVFYCVMVTKGSASWTVTRRYSDFRELRDQLKKEGGGSDKHFSFPAKNYTKMSAKQSDERLAKLDEFLQQVVDGSGCRSWVPTSSRQQPLYSFLDVGSAKTGNKQGRMPCK